MKPIDIIDSPWPERIPLHILMHKLSGGAIEKMEYSWIRRTWAKLWGRTLPEYKYHEPPSASEIFWSEL